MESFSVIRKIDELGRIVIPKEIRSALKLRTDDYVELIVTDSKLLMKKHSKIKNLKGFAQQLTDMLYSYTNKEILITDKSNIIAYSGKYKKKYLNAEISEALYESINRRESIMQNHVKDLVIINKEIISSSYVMDTIISNSDTLGSIIMYSEKEILSQSDMNVIKILSSFLNKYLEE